MLMQRLSLLAEHGRNRNIFKRTQLSEVRLLARAAVLQAWMMRCCHLVPTEENSKPPSVSELHPWTAHVGGRHPSEDVLMGLALCFLPFISPAGPHWCSGGVAGSRMSLQSFWTLPDYALYLNTYMLFHFRARLLGYGGWEGPEVTSAYSSSSVAEMLTFNSSVCRKEIMSFDK